MLSHSALLGGLLLRVRGRMTYSDIETLLNLEQVSSQEVVYDMCVSDAQQQNCVKLSSY